MENELTETCDLETENVLSIVTRLYGGLLITEGEKRKMEVLQPTEMKAAIFNLLWKKESVVAAKIFLSLRSRSGKYTNKTEESCTDNPFQNPMEMNTVIRNIFENLDVEDLKSCRKVCQKWNFEAEPFLRKKGTITFGLNNSESEIRHPEDFLETFRYFSESTTSFRFTSFRFLDKVEWRVCDLTNFLERQKNNIKELQLNSIKIFDEDGDWEETYDISDWFADLSISELSISCYENCCDATVFSFPLSKINSTTSLKLDQCSIDVEKERHIAPTNIDFTDLKFWDDDSIDYLSEYCLNDSVDFSKAKIIKIVCNDHLYYTIPKMDFSKCINISADYIELDNIEVVNWKDSKAAVTSLILDRVPFLEKTEMKIKELQLSRSSIDLFALPLSIEKLYLGTAYYKTHISCSQPIKLPNLTFLMLENSKYLRDLKFFANCSDLSDIEIEGGNTNVSLNLKWIPKSVKRMKLERVEICNTRRGRFDELKLEKLVLENYSLANAEKVMYKITPRILVIQWNREFELSGSALLFGRKFKNLVLYIGPFSWDNTINVFENNSLVGHVDKKSVYYVFENNYGRSIKKKEFEDMKILDKN